jgi:hypothetical protein
VELTYTYFKDGDWFAGYLNDYPEYQTQGSTLQELEEMLASLYYDLQQYDDIHTAKPVYTGKLVVTV